MDCFEVEMTTETVAIAFDNVTDGGLMVQDAFVGKLEQLKFSCPVKPSMGETPKV